VEHQRQAALQAFQGQPVAGVDARRAQDADAAKATVAAAEAAQARFGIDAPCRARRLCVGGPGFRDQRAAAVAIDAAGADVDDAPW
jgi:hypothetical protein